MTTQGLRTNERMQAIVKRGQLRRWQSTEHLETPGLRGLSGSRGRADHLIVEPLRLVGPRVLGTLKSAVDPWAFNVFGALVVRPSSWPVASVVHRLQVD